MYYGTKTVTGIAEADDNHKLIELEGGSHVKLSNLMAGVAITEQPQDPTQLRSTRGFPVVAELLKVLHSWDVQVGEIDFLFIRAKTSIEQSTEQATDLLWEVENSGEMTLDQVHKVLTGKVNAEKVRVDDSGSPDGETPPEAPAAPETEAVPPSDPQ